MELLHSLHDIDEPRNQPRVPRLDLKIGVEIFEQ